MLPFDSDAARIYAGVVSGWRQAGRPIAQLDAQIAAIALAHRAALVTRNLDDFEGCGLTVLNPFT